MATQILNLSLCLIEQFCMYIFMHRLFTSRFSSLAPMIIIGIINSLIIFSVPDFNAIKALISITTIFIGSSILYTAKPYIKLAFTTTLIYSFYIIDIVIGNILSTALDKQFLEVFYSDFSARVIICIITKLINIAVMVLIYKTFKKCGLNLEKRSWILFNIVMSVFLFVTVMYMTIYPSTAQDSQSALLYMLVSISFLAMSIIVIYFFTSICASFKQREKLYILQASHDSIEEKLSVQKQNSDKLQKIRHDMRNHLINTKILLENNDIDKASSLLNDIIGKTDNINISISQSTGNSIIDTIVAFKATVCENKNIAFEYKLDVLPELKIDYADISSVISNLIDNAVEAAEKTEKPYILLKIHTHGSYTNIFVKNTYNGNIHTTEQHNILATTKDDTCFHGYGTQIIKEIAEKYDGNYSWKESADFFITNVLLKYN